MASLFRHFSLLVLLTLSTSADISKLSSSARLEYDEIAQAHVDNLAKVNEPISKLGEKFTAALEKQKAAAQAAGSLDSVIAFESALKSFANGKVPDANSADPELAKVTKLYLVERSRLIANLSSQVSAAWRKHRATVDGLVTSLTKNGKIEDAKLVREELSEIDRTIAGLSSKTDVAASEWNGEWDVKYANDLTRRIRITMADEKTLNIQAIGGTWEPNCSYTAVFDSQKHCFYAEQCGPKGSKLRSETYVMENKRILIRHWLDEGTFEKPSVKATAKKSKED